MASRLAHMRKERESRAKKIGAATTSREEGSKGGDPSGQLTFQESDSLVAIKSIDDDEEDFGDVQSINLKSGAFSRGSSKKKKKKGKR